MSKEESTDKSKQVNSFLPIWLYDRIMAVVKEEGFQIKEAAQEAWTGWVADQASLSRQDDPARAKLIRDMENHLKFLKGFASIEVLQIAAENLAVPVRLAQSSLSQPVEETQSRRRSA
jgi:hypothetical protein